MILFLADKMLTIFLNRNQIKNWYLVLRAQEDIETGDINLQT